MRLGGTFFILILAITASAGCGPKATPVTPVEPGPAGNDVTASGEFETSTVEAAPEVVCQRIYELRDGGCGFAQGYDLTPDECQENYRRSFEERGPEAAEATRRFSRCLLDNGSCDAIEQCVVQLDGGDEGRPQFRTCDQTDVYAPVGVNASEWANRKGAKITRFSQHASTKEDPIEVCGIPSQMEWLLSLTCDDGSQPFRSYEHAHASRAGNVGAGGYCGSIIDLYEVPCPEGTHQIFIDAYLCEAPGASPRPAQRFVPPPPPPPSPDPDRGGR
jgi:hypothetical protein